MYEDWMPTLQLPLTLDQFRQLPRNAAYKYEYLEGRAYLSPRPRHYHALLDLATVGEADPVPLRPLQAEDIPALVPLFAGAFRATQPYSGLDNATRLEAARQALERTRTGDDGPWVERASFIALDEDRARPCGAVFITLLPGTDPEDFDSYYWSEPPPVDCVERGLGRPHLTWVFVSPLWHGQGVGTALLAAAARELRTLGYTQLFSTFLLGNDASTLWHWRNGFRLLANPMSLRQIRRRWERRQGDPGK